MTAASAARYPSVDNQEHDGGRPPLYTHCGYTKPFFDWLGKLIHAQQGKTPEYPY